MKTQYINNEQRITSYIAGSGLTIYEIEQYRADIDNWVTVGDSSENKAYIEASIAIHNMQVDFEANKEIRASQVCLGCNYSKPQDALVCWNCFKYRTDKTPLKYFEGRFQEWLTL